jgi:hypothetical protein
LRRGELDPPTRAGEAQVGELDARFGRDRHAACVRQRGKVLHLAGGAQDRGDDLGVGLVQLRLGVAHRPGQAAEDLRVGQRLAQRLGRLDLGREQQLEVGHEQVVELQEAGRRQHDAGEVGGVGLEEVDDDGEEVLAPQRQTELLLARPRGGDVHVPADERRGARGVGEAVRQVHVAADWRDAPAQVSGAPVGLVDPPGVEPVEVEEPRVGFAEVAGRRRQERAGPHHVATGGLALQHLPEPEQRRPGAVEAGGPLDQPGGHARRRLAPARRTVIQQRGRAAPLDDQGSRWLRPGVTTDPDCPQNGGRAVHRPAVQWRSRTPGRRASRRVASPVDRRTGVAGIGMPAPPDRV